MRKAARVWSAFARANNVRRVAAAQGSLTCTTVIIADGNYSSSPGELAALLFAHNLKCIFDWFCWDPLALWPDALAGVDIDLSDQLFLSSRFAEYLHGERLSQDLAVEATAAATAQATRL